MDKGANWGMALIVFMPANKNSLPNVYCALTLNQVDDFHIEASMIYA